MEIGTHFDRTEKRRVDQDRPSGQQYGGLRGCEYDRGLICSSGVKYPSVPKNSVGNAVNGHGRVPSRNLQRDSELEHF